ncbi:hypothetical protein EMMF5_004202 [Cystobasidiomycetes sp. EMM_F5]
MDAFEDEHAQALRKLAEDWVSHLNYWDARAKIPIHKVRYEDMKTSTFSQMLGILAFLLPASEQPSLDRIHCATRPNKEKGPYHSERHSPFYAYDHYSKDMLALVMGIVEEPWCRYGIINSYDQLFEQIKGMPSPVVCKQTKKMRNPKLALSGWYKDFVYDADRGTPDRKAHAFV